MIIILKLLLVLAFVIVLIWMLIRSFKGKETATLQAQLEPQYFDIPEAGYYSIWVNTKAYKGVPLTVFQPRIIATAGNPVKTFTSYLKPTITDLQGDSSMQLKYAYLPVGKYALHLYDLSKTDAVQELLIQALGNLKDESVGFRIKKTLPEYLFPLVLIMGSIPVMYIFSTLKPT